MKSKYQALQSLLRLRKYALEKEEQKLGERTREETMKQVECVRSMEDLNVSYQHTVGDAKAFDFLRRDKCVREAGNRHLTDLRQLALVQRARQAQIENTLKAKQRADMIEKVILNRQHEDQLEMDRKELKQMDDVSQNIFNFRQVNPN